MPNFVPKAWRRPANLPRLLFAALVAFALVPRTTVSAEVDLSHYVYGDTKQLVAMVEDAATLMEQKGEAAFADFKVPDSPWLHDDWYLFIYSIDGTCLFHPEEPDLVGKNLIDLRDIGGRQVIRSITDIARREQPDASGWVFYLWEDHTRLSPTWKAAYIRKVVTPDHKVYALGSGISDPKTERIFIKDNVDRAAAFILTHGKTDLEQLHNPSFNILDSYIFVMDMRGYTLVDPAFPNNEPRDMSNFTDAVGTKVIQNVLRRIADRERLWITYLVPKPGSGVPSRKLMYVRKIMVDGETLLVGSDYFLAIPIWMRE